MGREGQQGNVRHRDVNGKPTAARGGIDQKRNAAFGGDDSDGGDVLDCAEVVAGVMGGDEDCFVRNGFGNGIRRNKSFGIHGHARGFETVFLQPRDGLLDGRMLDV